MPENIQKIPVHLVDDPGNPMRGEAWDDDIKELAGSIKQFGLLQPVILRKVGERFEMIAGHRRLLAHRFLGVSTIDAVVRETPDDLADVLRVEENLMRRDVNPVDQAFHLKRYMDARGLSAAEAAEKFGRKEGWAKSRLEILAFPDYLIEFIRRGELSLSTAQILNQIPSPRIREHYCRLAAQQGLSANRARYWLDQAKLAAPSAGSGEGGAPGEPSAPAGPVIIRDTCLYCLEVDDMAAMEGGSFHRRCREQYIEVSQRSEDEAAEPAAS